MSDSSNNLDRKNNARPSFNARVCSNFQQQSWPQRGVTRAIIYPKGWMLGNWISDWETKPDLNLNEGRRPEWADWGGRGNWDLFKHSSSSFPPSYFTRNSCNNTQVSGWLQNFLWHYSGCLCFWIRHMHPHIVYHKIALGICCSLLMMYWQST